MTENANLYLDPNAVAVIAGYGKMGTMYTLQMMKCARPDQIVVIDPNPERQEQARQNGVPADRVFASFEDAAHSGVLGQSPILFFNVTPAALHYKLCKDVLAYARENGNRLAIVTEKPFTISIDQATEIAQELESLGAAFAMNMTCENAEFRPMVVDMLANLRRTHDVTGIYTSLGTNHLDDPRMRVDPRTGRPGIFSISDEVVHLLRVVRLCPEFENIRLDYANVSEGAVSDERPNFRYAVDGVWSSVERSDLKMHVWSGFNWENYQCPVIIELTSREDPTQRKFLQLDYDAPGTYQDSWILMHEDGTKERYLHIDTGNHIPPNARGLGKISAMLSENVARVNDFIQRGDPRISLGPNGIESAVMLQQNISPLQDDSAPEKVRVWRQEGPIPVIPAPLPDLGQLPGITPEAFGEILRERAAGITHRFYAAQPPTVGATRRAAAGLDPSM